MFFRGGLNPLPSSALEKPPRTMSIIRCNGETCLQLCYGVDLFCVVYSLQRYCVLLDILFTPSTVVTGLNTNY